MDVATARQNFALALKGAREQAELTQEELGEALGRSQSTVGDWEKAKTQPTPWEVAEIEELFKLPTGKLTRHLGYLPLGAAGTSLECTVEDAIIADDGLSRAAKESLLGVYRELVDRG